MMHIELFRTNFPVFIYYLRNLWYYYYIRQTKETV